MARRSDGVIEGKFILLLLSLKKMDLINISSILILLALRFQVNFQKGVLQHQKEQLSFILGKIIAGQALQELMYLGEFTKRFMS